MAGSSRYPLAVSGGAPVPIEEAGEGQSYSCVACRQPMSATAEPEPHFRHVDDQQAASCDSDLALHRVAIYYIKRGIESGAYEADWLCPRVSRPKAVGWECEPAALNLAVDCVGVESRIRVVPSADSDLVARYTSRDPVIIDVVNQQRPSPETEKAYLATGYLVFLVETSWGDVGMLKAGLDSIEVLNGLCGKCSTWEEWTRAWVKGEPWAMEWVKDGRVVPRRRD